VQSQSESSIDNDSLGRRLMVGQVPLEHLSSSNPSGQPETSCQPSAIRSHLAREPPAFLR